MTEAIRSREHAEGYIAMVCFKHGPPSRIGLELEWTVHHAADRSAPIERGQLASALGPYAPVTLAPGSPHRPLPSGSVVTVEPGGQVELSTPPFGSLQELICAARSDAAELRSLLVRTGLIVGLRGADPARAPRRILHTPRYDALEASFDRIGPFGRQMMSGTASLQICVDAGEGDAIRQRWRALIALGPALVGLFANSPVLGGRRTGWASSRLRAVLEMAPYSTTPPDPDTDPVAHWVRIGLEAPVVCVRRTDGSWVPPGGLTFAGWIEQGRRGGDLEAPTVADLDYHLTTLFPVVRPRGHIEVRYLDQQPADDWVTPVALLTALLSSPGTLDAAIDAGSPAAGRWPEAARLGMDDACVADAAAAVVDIGLAALDDVPLDAATRERVQERLDRLTARHRTVSGPLIERETA